MTTGAARPTGSTAKEWHWRATLSPPPTPPSSPRRFCRSHSAVFSPPLLQDMADAKTASKRATEAAAAAAEGEETTSGALSEPSGSSDSGNGGAAPAAPPHKKRKRPSDRKFPTGLQRAFERMRSQGRLLAVENAACCSTCAHAECAELLAGDDEAVGYVFYHSQDLEAAAGACRGRRAAPLALGCSAGVARPACLPDPRLPQLRASLPRRRPPVPAALQAAACCTWGTPPGTACPTACRRWWPWTR